MPKDWALVTATWNEIYLANITWGSAAHEVAQELALAHPSGLFFPYENAKLLQNFLRDPELPSGILFGYAVPELLTTLVGGKEYRGLAAFYAPNHPIQRVRRVVGTATGPAGGSL